MSRSDPSSALSEPAGPIRVACVSFLNSRPLIEGLDDDPAVRLTFDVPSRLIDRLADRSADVALLPVIDLPAVPGLRVVPAGGIGCDGPTLTVVVCSRVPIKRITTLSADTDSHTSVVLAGIVLKGLYGIEPRIVPLAGPAADCESVLLIGDKVVTDLPDGFAHQLDLGEAWKRWTGLPFVFAVWTARPDVRLGDLPIRLSRARERGLVAVDSIVQKHAVTRGWPTDLAHKYLSQTLRYGIGPRQILAIETFLRLAGRPMTLTQVPIG